MNRWHREQRLMQKRWGTVLRQDQESRQRFGSSYRNAMVDSGGGPGWMRKRRPNQGCGCPMCQWEKYEKGQGKRKIREEQYEHCAEGGNGWV